MFHPPKRGGNEGPFSSRFRVDAVDRFNSSMVKRSPRYHVEAREVRAREVRVREVKARFDRSGKCATSALTLSRSNQSRRCDPSRGKL